MKEWITQNKKSLLGENQPEPKVAAAEVRREVVTVRRATVPGKVEPATTTDYAVGPTISTSWIYL